MWKYFYMRPFSCKNALPCDTFWQHTLHENTIIPIYLCTRLISCVEYPLSCLIHHPYLVENCVSIRDCFRKETNFADVSLIKKYVYSQLWSRTVTVNWGGITLCAVLCQDLGLYLWLEGKINLWGAVGVSLFREWLTWRRAPCLVRDCCKSLVE